MPDMGLAVEILGITCGAFATFFLIMFIYYKIRCVLVYRFLYDLEQLIELLDYVDAAHGLIVGWRRQRFGSINHDDIIMSFHRLKPENYWIDCRFLNPRYINPASLPVPVPRRPYIAYKLDPIDYDAEPL